MPKEGQECVGTSTVGRWESGRMLSWRWREQEDARLQVEAWGM